MMLFKRLFGLTRSLFILYIHEHDRLGFGMLSVETAVIQLQQKRSVVSQSGRILFGIGEQYSEGKIHRSEPESGKGNVNTVYFVNQAMRNTQISRTAKCCLR